MLYCFSILVWFIRSLTIYQCYAQIKETPQNQQGDGVLYIKAKSLYSYTSLQTWTLHVSNVLDWLVAPSSVELDFYSSKGEGEGFLRWGPLIVWHLSRGVLVNVCWQMILSTMGGTLGIFFGWSVPGWSQFVVVPDCLRFNYWDSDLPWAYHGRDLHFPLHRYQWQDPVTGPACPLV